MKKNSNNKNEKTLIDFAAHFENPQRKKLLQCAEGFIKDIKLPELIEHEFDSINFLIEAQSNSDGQLQACVIGSKLYNSFRILKFFAEANDIIAEHRQQQSTSISINEN